MNVVEYIDLILFITSKGFSVADAILIFDGWKGSFEDSGSGENREESE